MIDVVREVSAFKPIDLARIPEKYKPATEQMRTAFILYNKALHEIQTGHDDAAKNYLRKAVVIFPEFYDAIMVLGILAFANGDRIGAVRIFNSVKNLEQRAISIGILDHLVEEAERPETARVLGTQKFSSERGKAESVMGGRTSASSRSEPAEAKYSKGQIFEKSSRYYEPQHKAPYGARKNTAYHRRPAEAQDEPSAEVVQDTKDVRLFNKYLLLIIAILLIFSVVVSTMLINKTASERELRNQLDALKAAQTPADATPDGSADLPTAPVTEAPAE